MFTHLNMETSTIIKSETWYGVDGTVIIGPGFIHKSGLGSFLVPHPPVVNWLLRRGLTEDARNILRVTHEFGHLQSAPLAVLYTAVNYAAIIAAGQANLLRIILVFISTHAAWEIMSESITILTDLQFYHKSYAKVSMIPRTIFWFSAIAFTLMGWVIALL